MTRNKSRNFLNHTIHVLFHIHTLLPENFKWTIVKATRKPPSTLSALGLFRNERWNPNTWRAVSAQASHVRKLEASAGVLGESGGPGIYICPYYHCYWNSNQNFSSKQSARHMWMTATNYAEALWALNEHSASLELWKTLKCVKTVSDNNVTW